jgi:hypothetical protein
MVKRISAVAQVRRPTTQTGHVKYLISLQHTNRTLPDGLPLAAATVFVILI